MAGEKIGIVACAFYNEIAMRMIEDAKAQAKALEAEIIQVITTPGAYDTPLAVKRLLEDPKIQGVVALGAVVKGETDHDKVICQSVAKTLQELSLDYDKPVTLGISGPGQTRKDALKRISKYATHSTSACIQMIRVLK